MSDKEITNNRGNDEALKATTLMFKKFLRDNGIDPDYFNFNPKGKDDDLLYKMVVLSKIYGIYEELLNAISEKDQGKVFETVKKIPAKNAPVREVDDLIIAEHENVVFVNFRNMYVD